jgi:hypothetical protein
MYSYISSEGEVLDWKFEKMEYGYNFKIGDKYIGQIFSPRHRSLGWTAVSLIKPAYVDGFVSRDKAAEWLIRIKDKKKLNNEARES